MAFGKRLGNPFGPAGPVQDTTACAPASGQPEFPNSRPIRQNLISMGDGTKDDSAEAPQRIVNFLKEVYRDERGVQRETILSATGALAGFSAQQAIWEGVVRTGKMTSAQAFVRAGTTNGETFFFGDFLNLILASTNKEQLSICRIVADALLNSGGESLPDLGPIVANCAKSIGTPAFGMPTWPGSAVLMEPPRQALRHWPRIKSILVAAGEDPLHWPLKIAMAAQKLIDMTKRMIPAQKAGLIVMEAAISMSKVDPRTVPGGAFAD